MFAHFALSDRIASIDCGGILRGGAVIFAMRPVIAASPMMILILYRRRRGAANKGDDCGRNKKFPHAFCSKSPFMHNTPARQ
jgi:hypothetical protein